MKYLLDTNKIIDYLKGDRSVIRILQDLRPKGLAVSVISIGEILEGIVDQPQSKRRINDLENFLSAVKVLDVDYNVVERFAAIRSGLRRAGKLIDNFDILIAATAVVYNLKVITADKDFTKIGELELY